MAARRRLLSASTLSGDRVFNVAGEDLGKIEDFMLDMETGRIAYAVLSFGGVLGIGGKLFAVPPEALTLDEDKRCFVLDASYDELAKAPGFESARRRGADGGATAAFDARHALPPSGTTARDLPAVLQRAAAIRFSVSRLLQSQRDASRHAHAGQAHDVSVRRRSASARAAKTAQRRPVPVWIGWRQRLLTRRES
jgi:hypothetical protein